MGSVKEAPLEKNSASSGSQHAAMPKKLPRLQNAKLPKPQHLATNAEVDRAADPAHGRGVAGVASGVPGYSIGAAKKVVVPKWSDSSGEDTPKEKAADRKHPEVKPRGSVALVPGREMTAEEAAEKKAEGAEKAEKAKKAEEVLPCVSLDEESDWDETCPSSWRLLPPSLEVDPEKSAEQKVIDARENERRLRRFADQAKKKGSENAEVLGAIADEAQKAVEAKEEDLSLMKKVQAVVLKRDESREIVEGFRACVLTQNGVKLIGQAQRVVDAREGELSRLRGKMDDKAQKTGNEQTRDTFRKASEYWKETEINAEKSKQDRNVAEKALEANKAKRRTLTPKRDGGRDSGQGCELSEKDREAEEQLFMAMRHEAHERVAKRKDEEASKAEDDSAASPGHGRVATGVDSLAAANAPASSEEAPKNDIQASFGAGKATQRMEVRRAIDEIGAVEAQNAEKCRRKTDEISRLAEGETWDVEQTIAMEAAEQAEAKTRNERQKKAEAANTKSVETKKKLLEDMQKTAEGIKQGREARGTEKQSGEDRHEKAEAAKKQAEKEGHENAEAERGDQARDARWRSEEKEMQEKLEPTPPESLPICCACNQVMTTDRVSHLRATDLSKTDWRCVGCEAHLRWYQKVSRERDTSIARGHFMSSELSKSKLS